MSRKTKSLEERLCQHCECSLPRKADRFCSVACAQDWKQDHSPQEEDPSYDERMDIGFLLMNDNLLTQDKDEEQ